MSTNWQGNVHFNRQNYCDLDNFKLFQQWFPRQFAHPIFPTVKFIYFDSIPLVDNDSSFNGNSLFRLKFSILILKTLYEAIFHSLKERLTMLPFLRTGKVFFITVIVPLMGSPWHRGPVKFSISFYDIMHTCLAGSRCNPRLVSNGLN